MKTRQRASRNLNKKYKNKYVSVKDIFNTIKSGIRIKSVRTSRMLTYAEYYAIVEAFLNEMIEMVVNEQEVFKMPSKLGQVYLKKIPHKRPFHVRIDYQATENSGELVLYKVPILDDEYTKVIWDRPYKFSKHKILPLKRFKEAIKKQ